MSYGKRVRTWQRAHPPSVARIRGGQRGRSGGRARRGGARGGRALEQPAPHGAPRRLVAWCHGSSREHCRLMRRWRRSESCGAPCICTRAVVIQYRARPQSSSARPPALNMGPAQATREAATASRVFSFHLPLTGPQSDAIRGATVRVSLTVSRFPGIHTR